MFSHDFICFQIDCPLFRDPDIFAVHNLGFLLFQCLVLGILANLRVHFTGSILIATNSKKRQTPAKSGKNATKTKTDTKTDTKTKTESDTKTEPEAAPQTAPQTEPHPGTANNTPGPEPFLPDGEAQNIQAGHSKVLDAAQNAGFKSSPAEQAGLLNLCAAYGPDRTVAGIGECVKHSAPNLAYLEAVLKGTRKKKQDPKDIHAYSQRDYSGEQQAAIERMMTMDW